MPLLDVAGESVHLSDRGSGDVVVFLHAFPLHGAMWDYQVDAFADVRRCVAVDLPGFGLSPAPASPGTATMDRWADLVAGALDQLDVRTATFVGCSMGGYLAMALLRRHPGLVGGLVLADTRARSDDDATAARRFDQQRQLREGAEPMSLGKHLVEGLLSTASVQRVELLDYVLALAEGGTSEGWLDALEAMRTRPDSMYVLRQAEVPAMVIVGEVDRITPIADATLLRTLLGEGTELVVVPGSGHLPNVEDPYAFNDALARFLGVELPAPPSAEEAPAQDAGTAGGEVEAG
ncbi:MAG: alpha/beta fold hydrolase [Acidimicrobiia bacterium]